MTSRARLADADEGEIAMLATFFEARGKPELAREARERFAALKGGKQ